MTSTNYKTRAPYFGLSIWYNRWIDKSAPTDEEITRAIKNHFKLEELRAPHVRAIRIGHGNTIQLGMGPDGWVVEEIFWAKK